MHCFRKHKSSAGLQVHVHVHVHNQHAHGRTHMIALLAQPPVNDRQIWWSELSLLPSTGASLAWCLSGVTRAAPGPPAVLQAVYVIGTFGSSLLLGCLDTRTVTRRQCRMRLPCAWNWQPATRCVFTCQCQKGAAVWTWAVWRAVFGAEQWWRLS